LARAVADETARRVRTIAVASGRPAIAPRRPLLVLLAAVAAIVTLALLLPAPTSRSWATLLDPNRAAPPVRIAVEPGSVRLTPGAALAVRARVWGTARAPRLLRDGSHADAATPEGAGVRGERVWRFDLTQLTREQDYRVRVAGVESPRYRISLAGEPSPVSFEIEIAAPAYARLPLQRGTATRGDVSALRGSRASLLVTFDRDLKSLAATLPGGRSAAWTAVTPRRWRGEVPVADDGEYTLTAVAERGEAHFRYRITPMADAPPLLSVRVPAGDVDLPVGQQIPVEVLAQDDLGLAKLTLQYRKDASAPWADLPIARFDGEPREAHVETRWDATPLALLPGQSATFRFELLDDNRVSGPGRAVSPTFELRFPSLADLYEHVDQKQQTAEAALQQIAEKAKELQKSLDKLARLQPRPAPQSSQGFERSEELKSALERQQELGRKIDDAAKEMRESLDQAAERQTFDQQLQNKLKELAGLMDQIQSKDFRDAMQKMRDALEKMDQKPLESELPQWRERNQQMLSNLQRTIELMKKLREEEKLQSLAQRADELKAEQDQMNQKMDAPPKDAGADAKPDAKPDAKSGAQNPAAAKDPLAEQQQGAAEKSEKLAMDAQKTGEDAKEGDEKQGLDEAAKELKSEAAPAQREASQQAQQKDRSSASKSGKRASQSLSRAAQSLRKMVSQMSEEQNQLDLAAVRRAAQDLLSLQRATEQNMDPTAPLAQRADRQTDLSEGTSRVADSLRTLATQTPFISGQLALALQTAVDLLTVSGRELMTGNRGRGEEAGRDGGRALNLAVLELRRTEESMCQKPGAGAPSSNPRPGSQPQNGQNMQDLAGRQGQLNQRTRGLSQRLSQQLRLQAGDRDEVQRLAEEQQRIREQLEQVQRDEQSHHELLGRLDQTQQEMKEVEEALRNGVTDPSIEEKQTHILSRMLDATRSINRRDFDPERESRPGVDVARPSPAELPRELMRESDRLRLDLLKAEADRYPAQYRAFIETYLKSLNGSPR
ncbi:MAG: hypothetical protein HY076_05895, partial [Candidatus Eisenbacteria bacterium]|nr:hypothetical protein [Candidatus Eisenbacteria bacterium]